MAELDTSNPHLLKYSNEILKIEVPGGVKLEGLDRMRVTLKVELKDSPAHRYVTIWTCTTTRNWKSSFVKQPSDWKSEPALLPPAYRNSPQE